MRKGSGERSLQPLLRITHYALRITRYALRIDTLPPMLRAFIKHADGRVSRDTSPEALAAALRDPGSTFWLDMLKPTDEEYALLDEVFGFHPLAIEDTLNYMQRPKIESYDHVGEACTQAYFYMVFHGPDLASFKQK